MHHFEIDSSLNPKVPNGTSCFIFTNKESRAFLIFMEFMSSANPFQSDIVWTSFIMGKIWFMWRFGTPLLLQLIQFTTTFFFFLMAQVGGKNQEGYDASPISLEKGIALVKDVFISAAERDIYTGDGIAIHIITKDGIKEERFPLRRDWRGRTVFFLFFSILLEM